MNSRLARKSRTLFASPSFFQLLVDKVVPNQAFSTLYALSAGVGVLILFDAGFNYLRNYLLAFITRRLDHQVANSTIEHLLRLPIDYFHANPSGVTAYKRSAPTARSGAWSMPRPRCRASGCARQTTWS